MGRKLLFPEHVNLSLPEGSKAAMDAVLRDGEDRLQMIRAAIDKEIAARKRTVTRAKKPPAI